MDGSGDEQQSQTGPTCAPGVGQFQVNHLRKGLKNLLKLGCSEGFPDKTIYGQAWMAAMRQIFENISHHFWTNPLVTTMMMTRLFKYEYGQFRHMIIACRQARPYFPGSRTPRSDSCRHCGQADSWVHILEVLGGCQVPFLQGNVCC